MPTPLIRHTAGSQAANKAATLPAGETSAPVQHVTDVDHKMPRLGLHINPAPVHIDLQAGHRVCGQHGQHTPVRVRSCTKQDIAIASRHIEFIQEAPHSQETVLKVAYVNISDGSRHHPTRTSFQASASSRAHPRQRRLGWHRVPPAGSAPLGCWRSGGQICPARSWGPGPGPALSAAAACRSASKLMITADVLTHKFSGSTIGTVVEQVRTHASQSLPVGVWTNIMGL